jgi:N-acetylmuramoyl-L-alanine amidase
MRYLTVKQRIEVTIILILIVLILKTIYDNENKVTNVALFQQQPNIESIRIDNEFKRQVSNKAKTISRVINTVNNTPKYTKKELELLYAITWAESGNQPYAGQVAVAETVINRVDSGIYPDTIKQVVYQKSQFNGVERSNFGYYTDETKQAVHEAINSPTFDKSVVYFANVSIATNRGFIRKVIEPNKVVKIGEHTFASEPKLEDKKGD